MLSSTLITSLQYQREVEEAYRENEVGQCRRNFLVSWISPACAQLWVLFLLCNLYVILFWVHFFSLFASEHNIIFSKRLLQVPNLLYAPKEMATHSSVLAWRIPGMVEPGGLPSMGSHRVGHNWNNLAALLLSYSLIPPYITFFIEFIFSGFILIMHLFIDIFPASHPLADTKSKGQGPYGW